MSTVSLERLPPTPEHDKFHKARAEPLGEHLSGFCDHLVYLGIQFMVWMETDEEVPCDNEIWLHPSARAAGDHSQCSSCHGSKVVNKHWEGWLHTSMTPAELIAGYLGIDYKAFQ